MKKEIIGILLATGILVGGSITASAAESSMELNFTQNKNALESTNQVTMLAEDKKDLYSFTLDAEKKVDFTLDSGDKTVSIYLKDADGNNLLFMNNDVTNDKISDEIGLPKGEYTIEVNRRYSHEGDIPYKLSIKLTNNKYYEIETNGTFGTANNVLLNTTYNANSHMMRTGMDVFYEKDFFRFEVPVKGTYGIKIDGEQHTPRTYLYGQGKNFLEEITSYNNKFELSPGVYYLKINNTSAYYEHQPYSFEINYLKFKDVVLNHWAIKEIAFLSDRNIIAGYGDGTFKANKEVTRYEAAVMIVKALGLNTNNKPSPSFTDVSKKHWAYDAVATAVDAGIFEDVKKFNGSQPLTREQMAKILVDAYDLKGTTLNKFSDVQENRWSSGYISTLLANNITAGFTDGTFRPASSVTRAQYVSFLARLLDDKYKPLH
jgi:hypothetical protein